MVVNILNFIHSTRFRWLLPIISQLVYLLKGNGWVSASYHPDFRAYSYKVRGTTYLSMGPGWASSYDYLEGLIRKSYNHFYLPKTGDCVLDIGAGLGEESIIYAKLVGLQGKVYSLEANPHTFAGLSYLFSENGLNQAKACHIAMYNHDGEVTIEDDAGNYLTNTINAGGTITVKSRTLDTFVRENKIERIDFLKSNIEGAEQYLIDGMTHSLHIIKNLCISCHDFRHVYHNHGEFYMTKEKIKSFLEQNKFETMVRTTGDRVVDDYIYARNTRL